MNKKKKKRKAKPLFIYRCHGCGSVYSVYLEDAGPQKDCKKCGSLYFDWVNYEEMLAKGQLDG